MKTKKLLLTMVMASFAMTSFGQTWNIGSPNATDVTATLSNGTLTIKGTGATADYDWPVRSPWNDIKNQILKVQIQNGVTSIGNEIFSGCDKITYVAIPNTVQTIGRWSFASCGFTSITIPEGVISIGFDAFAGCPFTSILIPNSVKILDNYAFEACENLTSVTIGSGITNIGFMVFVGCNSLSSITCLNPDPASIVIDNSAFDGMDVNQCVLRVPAASVSLYLKAPVWKNFSYIVADDGSVVDIPNLANLTVSAGTLSPAFSSSVYAYTVTVPSSVSTITLTATPVENASVSGAGQKSLATGDNTFNIVVTTKDGENTYTVKVTRMATDYILTLISTASETTTYLNVTTPIVKGYYFKFQLITGKYSGNLPFNFNLLLNGSQKVLNAALPVNANSIYEFTLHISLTNPAVLTVTTYYDAFGKPSYTAIDGYDFHPCSVTMLDGTKAVWTTSVDLPWTIKDASLTGINFIGNGNFTSVREIMSPIIPTVFPNPAVDEITVSGLQEGEMLYVYNVNGQQMFMRKATGETERFAVGHLPAGVYILKVNGQILKWIKK